MSENAKTLADRARRRFLAGATSVIVMADARNAQAAETPRFWGFSGAIESMERLFALEDARPPGVEIVNSAERRQRAFRPPPSLDCDAIAGDDWLAHRDWAPPHLRITAPGFAPDYVHTHGALILSRRLREAMALPERAADWRPIETRGSTPEAIAQDYQELIWLPTEDALDAARADFEIHETPCRRADGAADVVERKIARRIYWRPDAAPTHELFVLRHHGMIVAADALATRVLKAGITDVAFLDQQAMQEAYDRDPTARDLILKTL